MPIFMQKKCPTCGGRLELISNNKYECRCCHNVYEMHEGNTSLYDSLQTASTFRESLNFKQAEMLYKNMLKKYANEDLSDVYWNLLLCEQRVMFETDQNGEQFPSFYDIAQTEIDESEYYSKAIEYAQEYDSNKLMCFVDLANKMQEAKSKYRTIKNSTKPYDIFICFKKSSLVDPDKLTKDYQLAYDLYNHLSTSYKVFFSERSLDNIVIREYEPNIYHALYTAKIMLVLCSDIDYLNSQWVRNEWSRFKMMTRTSAQAKSIIPIFIDGFSPEQLPDELRSCQGYNNDIYLMQKLGSAIKAIINPVDKEAEIAAKLQAELQAQKAEMSAQMEQQMNALKEQLAEHKTVATEIETPQNYIVPYGTKEIRNQQFQWRQDLTSISIPNTVTSIDYMAFWNCQNLAKINIPDSVEHIGNNAFLNTKWYDNQPNGVVYAGKVAYKYKGDKHSITSIVIKEGTKSIATHAFEECSELTSVTIPDSVTSIDYNAFSGCSKLANVTIPDSVNVIDSFAFCKCSELTSVKIGKSVAKIAPSAFWDCPLTDIVIAPDNPNYHYANNCIIETKSKTLISVFRNSTIPNDGSITTIGGSAFYNCNELTNITIPNSVTNISNFAFSGCSELANVIISPNVTSIGTEAFSECSKLISITIPDGVTVIDYATFKNCYNLTSVTMTKNLTNIGNEVFQKCRNLSDIHFNGTKKEWKKIHKYRDWDKGTGKYIVHCTDGDIKKSLF
ncbi:MAG: leucine-rich repeat protein [Clostridia bacterium]|nr:leucine-rich repeat protein [Clostridia bacterium]